MEKDLSACGELMVDELQTTKQILLGWAMIIQRREMELCETARSERAQIAVKFLANSRPPRRLEQRAAEGPRRVAKPPQRRFRPPNPSDARAPAAHQAVEPEGGIEGDADKEPDEEIHDNESKSHQVEKSKP
jgi:hypothetical protein